MSMVNYDNNNKIREITLLNMSPAGLENSERYVLTRDAGGKVIYEEYYEPGQGNTWSFRNHKGYIHDNQNNLIYDSSCHGAYYCTMSQYEYNNNGKIEEELILTTTGVNALDSLERNSYSYYLDGKKKTRLNSIYNRSLGIWDTSSIDSFVYAGFNNYSAVYTLHKDPQTNTFVYNARELRKYNNAGNPYQISYDTWSTSNQIWRTKREDTLVYDTNGLLISLISKQYSSGSIPLLTTTTNNVYYEPINTTIQKTALNEQGPLVYPNPTSDNIYIHSNSYHIESVTVTDITGQTLRNVSFDSQSSVHIDLGDLPAANYILTVISVVDKPHREIITIR